MNSVTIVFATAAAITSFAAGCSQDHEGPNGAARSKALQQWGALRVGMTTGEVMEVLGKPTATLVLRNEIGEHQLPPETLALVREVTARQQYEIWTYDSSHGTSAVVPDGTNMLVGHRIRFDHEGRITAIGQPEGHK